MTGVEFNILNFIQESLSSTFMDTFMKGVTTLGNDGIIWIVMGIGLLFNKKTRFVGWTLLFALLLNVIVGDLILKNLIRRTRPFIEYPQIKLIIDAPNSFSFPSGHTNTAFAAVTVLLRYFKKKSYIFLALACLCAFSRLYLQVHYPTDVLGGIIVGVTCGFTMCKISEYVREKVKAKKAS